MTRRSMRSSSSSRVLVAMVLREPYLDLERATAPRPAKARTTTPATVMMMIRVLESGAVVVMVGVAMMVVVVAAMVVMVVVVAVMVVVVAVVVVEVVMMVVMVEAMFVMVVAVHLLQISDGARASPKQSSK